MISLRGLLIALGLTLAFGIGFMSIPAKAGSCNFYSGGGQSVSLCPGEITQHRPRRPARYRFERHYSVAPAPVIAPCGLSFPCAPKVGGAQPTGKPYVKPAVTEVVNGIKYTGNSCIRREGTTGREGYGPNGDLGCWRF